MSGGTASIGQGDVLLIVFRALHTLVEKTIWHTRRCWISSLLQSYPLIGTGQEGSNIMTLSTANDTEAIWSELSAGLRRFILKHVPDEDSADDILQDVFISIHSHAASLRDDRKLQSWIYQITRNAIVDYYRSRKPTVELTETLEAVDDGDGDDPARELAPCIREMVDDLPEKYRQAILLTEFQGLSQQDLADRLGISLSGAKSRVQRAKEQLRTMLLQCCHFELDRRGKIIEYYPNCCCCVQAGHC